MLGQNSMLVTLYCNLQLVLSETIRIDDAKYQQCGIWYMYQCELLQHWSVHPQYFIKAYMCLEWHFLVLIGHGPRGCVEDINLPHLNNNYVMCLKLLFMKHLLHIEVVSKWS